MWQNPALHLCACLWSFLHSLGRRQGHMFICPMWNQTPSLSSERLCWQAHVDPLQDQQISGPRRDARMQRAGRIGKNIDFDILSLHIFKEEKCTENCTFLIRCYQRFSALHTHWRLQNQQSPTRNDLYEEQSNQQHPCFSLWLISLFIWVAL